MVLYTLFYCLGFSFKVVIHLFFPHNLQWNSHGYDIAKMFGSKLTSVSPVWLQLRRRGLETFDVTGLHDHDPGRRLTKVLSLAVDHLLFMLLRYRNVFVFSGWVKAVRKSNKKVKIGEWMPSDGAHSSSGQYVFCCAPLSLSLFSVPRLLFDGWSYQDYMSVLASEDEIEELASELLDVAKVIKHR